MIPQAAIKAQGNEACATLLRELYSQQGVTGTCLQHGADLIAHDLPFADSVAADIAAKVDRLLGSYEGVGRGIWQVVAGFEEMWLVILTRDALRLTVLLKPGTDPAQIASRGTRVLLEMNVRVGTGAAETEPGTTSGESGGVKRESFERAIVALMSRVTGHAQIAKLMQREFAAAGLNGTALLSREQARTIGTAVFQNIPNRGKRDALISEFVSTLDL